MVWANSTRSARLPPNWPQLRTAVWERDGDICWVCHLPGADEIDHKQAGDNHDLANLAPIHNNPCHRRKSASEGAQARNKFKRCRSAEPHPGMVPTHDLRARQ